MQRAAALARAARRGVPHGLCEHILRLRGQFYAIILVMNRFLPIFAGTLAIACFATEMLAYCYAPYSRTAGEAVWLQYGFFLFFLLQVVLTAWLHLQAPEKHLDGLTLAFLITAILLFIISIPLYHVIMRVLNFVVRNAGPILP